MKKTIPKASKRIKDSGISLSKEIQDLSEEIQNYKTLK